MSLRACVAAIVIAGCSSSSTPPPRGRVVLALSIDWEGAYVGDEALDALDRLRETLGDAPVTHFVSAAYFTKQDPDPDTAVTISEAIRKGDELAVHLHGWKSLATAAGIAPRTSPSFLTGTDQVIQIEDDVGFDTDLDTYNVTELRALLRTTRKLLEQMNLPVTRTFRAGGYLGSPKLMRAIHAEGFVIDSSATDHHQLGDAALNVRLEQLWPGVTSATQPFLITVPGGQLLEMPIAAIADYTSAADMARIIESAHGELRKAPARNVFVVLAFHFETAAELGDRIREAVAAVRARPDIADDLLFTTVEHAAYLARAALP